jgi:GAF domain-containing protein
VRWPGDELALVGLLAFTAAVAIALARLLRRQRLIERPLGVNP